LRRVTTAYPGISAARRGPRAIETIAARATKAMGLEVRERGVYALEAETGEGVLQQVEAGEDDVVAEGGEKDTADFEFFASGDIGS